MWPRQIEFVELVGKTFIQIDGLSDGNDMVTFITNTGEKYTMYHSQDCCEHVNIESVVGDVSDLLNTPILGANEEISDNDPEGFVHEHPDWRDSFTWTFYKLRTQKGYVDIRWLGESNGYYSERVSLYKEE